MPRPTASYISNPDMIRKQRAFTKEDFLKTRLLFRLLFLLAFMAILSLFYIWSRVQVLQYGYEINELRSKQQQMIELNKKLKLEVATLKSPQRIEQIASQQLHMASPDKDHLFLLP